MTKNYERTLPASGQETENILEARKELIRLNVYQCVDLFEYKEKGYRGQEMHIFQAFVEDGIHHHENNYVGLCKKTTTLLRRIEADEVLSKIDGKPCSLMFFRALANKAVESENNKEVLY